MINISISSNDLRAIVPGIDSFSGNLHVIVLLSGLALGAAMILPLGPQNAFVMNQGIRRQYHLMIALLCAVSDLLLICAGIFGGSALLMQSPWLLALVTWGGVAFCLVRFGALKTALSSNLELASAEVMKQGRWKIIVTMLAVTWLNPHVYLDTFVVLGSLGGQLAMEPKRWFALGTISASFLWFFGLALLAAWLAPRLRTAKAQRISTCWWSGDVVYCLPAGERRLRHVQALLN
jgi:L-lysine exporter family protein LysE/ArgO